MENKWFMGWLSLSLAVGSASFAQETPAAPASQEQPKAAEKKEAAKPATSGTATTGALANVVTGPPPANAKPWTGSFILYSHNLSALTLNKAAEPYYNPTYNHQLDLRPQWNLGTRFFLRGRLMLSQELTLGDDTTYRNEVVLSDTWLDVGWRGTRIEALGLNVAANVRVFAPTSKGSQAETLVGGIGPGILLVRSFPVWGGLTLLADARVNRFFHRYTTSQNESPAVAACGDIRELSCNNFVQTGVRNAFASVGYGGGFSLSANDKLSFSSQFRMSHSFLYELSDFAKPTVGGLEALPTDAGTNTRHIWGFFFDVNYQLTPAFALSAGTFTFAPQLAPDGQHQNPFFSRFTMFHFDLGINVEALLSQI